MCAVKTNFIYKISVLRSFLFAISLYLVLYSAQINTSYAQVVPNPANTKVNAAAPTVVSAKPVPRAFSLVHTKPLGSELPYPGQPMLLAVQLTNTKETKYKVKLALVKDGKFMEVAARDGYLDVNDRPIFEAHILAPLAEMSYQFTFIDNDGTPVSSQRYSVRRDCIPNVALAEGGVAPEIQGNERLQKLVSESKALENDLSGYERVNKLLADLKAAVGE